MRSFGLAACLALGLAAPAAAQPAPRDRTWFGTVYLGQWTTNRLADIPGRIVNGDLETIDSYYASGAISRVLVRNIRTGWPVIGRVLDGSSIEIEGQLGQHFGQQRNLEGTLSLLWRSPEGRLPLTDIRWNFAVGEGLSYAFSTPQLEDQINVPPPQRLLNYLSFEFEFSHPSLPGVSLVPRIHHRSGAYGVFAPEGSGSNMVGVGLRMTLQ